MEVYIVRGEVDLSSRMDIKVIWLWYVSIISTVGAYNILFIPNMYPSIHLYISNIAEAAVKAGHKAYFALPTSIPSSYIEGAKTMGIEVIFFKSDVEFIFETDSFAKMLTEAFVAKDKAKFTAFMQRFTDFENDHAHSMLNDQAFITRVNKTNFDMVILSMWDVFIQPAILPLKLSLPYIQIHTLFCPWGLRVPALPSFVPTMHCVDCTDQMSFSQRFRNAYRYFMDIVNDPVHADFKSAWLHHFPNTPVPSRNEILNGAALVINNIDPVLSYPLPTMPNIILTGGLSLRPVKALNTEMVQYLNSSNKDIILISFGSTLTYLQDVYLNKLIGAFAKLRQFRFIMKYNGDSSRFPPNVRISKWLPQNELLAHPKTRLFITHGGTNGQMEALYHGVPMVVSPIYVDQDFNARRVEHHGYGRRFDLAADSETTLVELILEVVMNETYRLNIQRASKIFRDRPMSAPDKAVFWINHVIKYGSKHLRSYGQDMPLYQFWMIDILLFLSCVVVLALLITIVVIKMTVECMRSMPWKQNKLKSS